MNVADVGPVLLVGAGRMGGAMLEGWLARGLDPALITLLDPSPPQTVRELAAARGLRLNPDDPATPPPAVMMLAVKPQAMDDVLASVAGHVAAGTAVISVAAGKTIRRMAALLPPATPIVRTIPNTPAAIGRGITVCVANEHVDGEQKAAATALLEACGEVAWIEDEAQMDAVTAVSGSGPAYVFLLAECLAAAARDAGLPAELSERLARATVSGAGELLHRSDDAASTLRENVTSPGGTTAEALGVLMAENGLAPLMREAVAAAARRSRELAG